MKSKNMREKEEKEREGKEEVKEKSENNFINRNLQKCGKKRTFELIKKIRYYYKVRCSFIAGN